MYSSQVLLAKMDEGWGFCVDYHKLNLVKVSDKFPILVIEELLDELHEVVVFLSLTSNSDITFAWITISCMLDEGRGLP